MKILKYKGPIRVNDPVDVLGVSKRTPLFLVSPRDGSRTVPHKEKWCAPSETPRCATYTLIEKKLL